LTHRIADLVFTVLNTFLKKARMGELERLDHAGSRDQAFVGSMRRGDSSPAARTCRGCIRLPAARHADQAERDRVARSVIRV
jgi:hypothetical protein